MSIPRATWTLQSGGSELFSLLFSTSVTLKKVLSILKLQIPFLCVLSCSVISNSLWPHELYPARLLCPWGFSMLEYWSGLPCSPPGHLPNPGIEPRWDKWFKMSPRNKCRIRGSFSVILAHNSYCYTVHGVLKARMLKWFAIPFSSGPPALGTHHHLSLPKICGSVHSDDLISTIGNEGYKRGNVFIAYCTYHIHIASVN